MSFSKSDLLANPHLLDLLSEHDKNLLRLTTPALALTQAPAPTPDSTPASPPPLTSAASKQKKDKLTRPSKPELQSHAEYLHWIKKTNRSLPPDKPLLALHADPTCPSGILPGWPDFTLFHYAHLRPLFIEFKRPRQGRLSPAQSLIHRYLHALGHHVYVVSYCHHAITITQNFFSLPPS